MREENKPQDAKNQPIVILKEYVGGLPRVRKVRRRFDRRRGVGLKGVFEGKGEERN